MNLPRELIEKILLHADGKTLLNARQVDTLKESVDYLTKKTPIWKWCCRDEIPTNQLLEYLTQYKKDDEQKWLHIYINWWSWENPDKIITDIILTPMEFNKVNCMAVAGDFLAVGTQDGRLKIFSKNYTPVYSARIFAVRINKLTFIESEQTREGAKISLVIAFKNGLHIFCLDGLRRVELVIPDVKSHSVYKNYICYEKNGGRMTITRLDNVNGGRELVEIWFSRIYSPSSLSCMNMWEGVCTFLINNEVKTIEYENPEVSPMDCMKKKTRIKFNFPLVDSQSTQILRDDIVISLYKNEDVLKCDFIEFFLLSQGEKYSKKMFYTWETFRCYITCIYLYGNILMLGMDVGIIYVYHVSCWKNLDIREYSHKLIIGKHPIISINVNETATERRIYASSKFRIHEITGFWPNVF